MSPNRRLSILIASILVLGLGALVALYVPLRKLGRTQEAEQESPWPEAAELEFFLEAREAMMPVYEEYGETFRAAADPATSLSRPPIMRVAVGYRQMVDVMMAALVSRKMSVDRFLELTDLVYLRWWRVADPEPAPELELMAHIERHLENRRIHAEKLLESEGEPSPKRKQEEEEYLAERRGLLEALRPVAEADPEERLGDISDEARALLEAHRERIAATDMDTFDCLYLVRIVPGKADQPGSTAGTSDGPPLPPAGE